MQKKNCQKIRDTLQKQWKQFKKIWGEEKMAKQGTITNEAIAKNLVKLVGGKENIK